MADPQPGDLLGSDLGSSSVVQSAVRLPSGHTLVADSAGRRVTEYRADKTVAWHYDSADDPPISGPTSAEYLPAATPSSLPTLLVNK